MRRVLTGVGLLAATAAIPATAWALSAGAAAHNVKATASGQTVTISGAVALKPADAVRRRATKVLIQLNGVDHAYERKTVTVNAKDAYRLHWATRLTGELTVAVQTYVSGRASGRPAVAHVDVAAPTNTVTVTQTVTAPTSTPTSSSTPYPGTPLLGLFKLAAGAIPRTGAATGTYVEMFNASGGVFPNVSSTATNKAYTPFQPGSDGGLSTVAYEPSPSPAFAGGTSGNSLANGILTPAQFEGVDFGISTQAKDVDTGQADPIPQIDDDNGTLSGQISGWDAQWNGQSFNQGSPKPDGTLPGHTTKLTGTYDAATGAFTLSWYSEIVGGSFNSYYGYWHLAGTFVPASP